MTLNDRDAYHFELAFSLPQHQCIHSEKKTLTWPSTNDQPRLSLRPESGSGLVKDARLLSLLGYGYSTESEAVAAGRNHKVHLSIVAMESSIGLAWLNLPTQIEAGLFVWKGRCCHARARSSAIGAAIVGINGELFKSRLDNHKESKFAFSGDQLHCFYVLMDIHFENSSRAKFIRSMAVIERLSPGATRSNRFCIAIGELKKIAERLDLNKQDLDTLNNGLDFLKGSPPRARCAAEIEKRLGASDRRAFNKLWDDRTDLAHKGITSERLDAAAYEAHSIASRLLLAQLGGFVTTDGAASTAS